MIITVGPFCASYTTTGLRWHNDVEMVSTHFYWILLRKFFRVVGKLVANLFVKIIFSALILKVFRLIKDWLLLLSISLSYRLMLNRECLAKLCIIAIVFQNLLEHKKNYLVRFLQVFVEFVDFVIFPFFDTKVTEYLCSVWVFFSSDKFQLFN